MIPAPLISWSRMLTLLIMALAASAICGAIYWREADQIEKNVLDREAKRTEIFGRFVEQDIESAAKDLQQLVDGDGLQDYLLSGKKGDLDRALHRAWFCCKLNPDYDQVRFLDERGEEIIRINANGATVPPDQLQNRADRTYFQKTNALAPGQFFLSAFELNDEHGRVELPPKPILRIGLPVFDSTGRRRGVYLINYLGGNLISRLEKFTPQYQPRLRILNSKGYWIKGAEAAQEWGFMFPERSGFTLAQSDPDLWAQISRAGEGQMPHANGFFTWYRIVPRAFIAGHLETVAEDDFLVIGSEISPLEWNIYFSGMRQSFAAIDIILLFLVAICWRFFYLRERAQQEMDRFFDLARDMFCIAGFDGYFKRVNPAWAKTLGYTKEEMLSAPYLDFVHPEDRNRTVAESANLMKGGETISFENRYRCKDGSYRWLSWGARSLVGEQTIYATARDLTERKQAERQILQLNEQLKHRADELEKANNELEAFSYSVSHDLRAPLRHINGFVEILQNAPVLQGDASSRRHMSVIARAARDMGLLIDDLLSLSRTGRAEMHPMKIEMRELIDDSIRELENERKDRKVTWEIKPLPKVSCDASLMRLVWTNLLSNALKYTRPRPEARIEIDAFSDGEGASRKGEAVFYIRDNGVGFEMRYASKLFGVFQRLHRADEFEGTGIGLANVQRIIQRHGGRVWAEGRLGEGATFYFSLPLILTNKTNDPKN